MIRPKGGGDHQEIDRHTDKYKELVVKCRAQIHRNLGESLPALAIVLGSGFQSLLGRFEIQREIAYRAIGFPVPTVSGHAGTLAVVEIDGLECLVCSGRAHYYEGNEMDAVTFPVRVLAACGVRELLLTNAAGGINRRLARGDFMVATDHINFMGANPLRGMEGPQRFVDLSAAHSGRLREELTRAARQAKVRLRTGVYLAVSGPSYETPAEIRAFAKWGADAVGMSTVPEVLMARALGLEVAAVSCITNAAAGLSSENLSHEEVLRAGQESASAAERLLREFARGRKRQAFSPEKRKALRKNLKMNRPQLGSGAKSR